jgi:hypothetical protein
MTTVASVAFMLPVLFGFCVDWWITTGLLAPPVIARLAAFSEGLLQPVLRAVLLVLLLLVLRDTPVVGGFGVWGWMGMISVALIILGLLGRVGAVLLMLSLGYAYPTLPASVLGEALVVTVSWVMLLGTGRFSLWQWDEQWVKRYDGAR